MWNSEEYGRRRAKASVMPCGTEGEGAGKVLEGGQESPILVFEKQIKNG